MKPKKIVSVADVNSPEDAVRYARHVYSTTLADAYESSPAPEAKGRPYREYVVFVAATIANMTHYVRGSSDSWAGAFAQLAVNKRSLEEMYERREKQERDRADSLAQATVESLRGQVKNLTQEIELKEGREVILERRLISRDTVTEFFVRRRPATFDDQRQERFVAARLPFDCHPFAGR